jgi:hypothetical protein
MRQYKIFLKPTSKPVEAVKPVEHEPLYALPSVENAVLYMRGNPDVVAIGVRTEAGRLDLFAFDQEALAPDAFIL